MIYLGFIFSIVILIYAIYQNFKHDEWRNKYWDEVRVHLDTQSQLDAAHEEINDLTNKLDLFEETIRKNEKEESQEVGVYVSQRKLRPATPDLYRVVFDMDVNGQRILEDLTKRFNRNAYVSDAHGGERETCRRLGQSEPVNFILQQINLANDPDYSEAENDE
ncbi:hypothetical protein F4U02_16165 [Acinetobacter haemolyticus]|uniref:Bbp19-like phage domain-containing protein n=1 Tax=Acinetobacter haemolyticus TaxID=29430 RepID=A0A4P7B3U8_ACIHA|nr:hypothetical protein [Acinetobacter haemolyticus]MQZ32512.1 hypothetical protein [Acinetobacter haemolyticus]NAR50341.1 hypothetical protein [Acinetobacter haemolyticus]NAS08140.1 hypothetical protein [Acinetobacter haemolyticus]QBQ15603.1 hypothetical protein AHTJR_04660 [Acinetobacter haemolyticus]